MKRIQIIPLIIGRYNMNEKSITYQNITEIEATFCHELINFNIKFKKDYSFMKNLIILKNNFCLIQVANCKFFKMTYNKKANNRILNIYHIK